MKIYRIFSIAVFRLLLITSLIGLGAVQADAGNRKTDSLDAGYSALRLFLKDEQHLTTIRRLKLVIGFESISDKSVKLIDDIADTSAEALDQLEQLAAARPAIVFEDFSDESIGKSTLDSLRYATAKEFLFETENFETTVQRGGSSPMKSYAKDFVVALRIQSSNLFRSPDGTSSL